MFAKTLQVAIFAVLLSAAASVRIGDEAFRTEACGLFYVFAERAIHVVDGATMDVVKTIETDMDGNPLETVDGEALAWADVVYMEDASSGRHVIFANVRNELPAEDGSTQSEVVVVDTIAQEVIDRVVVGGRPVHLYGVFELNEMWTHSDAEATFDVIHLDDTGRLHAENIPGLEDVEANGNHGKLLVDGGLDFVGYATNTGEPFLFEIDLVAKEKIGDHPWSEFNSQCRGGHAISYSNINKHIYVEGTGCGSILEFDTVSKQYIHFWENVTGALYQTPDEDLVVAIDKSASKVTFFVPQNNGERSTIAYTVSVPGNPGSAAFWGKEGKELGTHELEDHLVFFPLTRNTLKANIEAVTDLGDGRDVTDSGYYSAPFDCQYDESGSLALNEQGEPITPGCGSCALERATVDDYDISLSGFAWVDMQEVVNAASSGETVEAKLISAGAVLQGNPYSYSNECAYGRTYRVAMMGGKYVCTIADLPESSICCIDASTQQLVGCTPTSNSPARIAYAPPRLGVGAASCPAVEDDDGSTAGAGRKLL